MVQDSTPLEQSRVRVSISLGDRIRGLAMGQVQSHGKN